MLAPSSLLSVASKSPETSGPAFSFTLNDLSPPVLYSTSPTQEYSFAQPPITLSPGNILAFSNEIALATTTPRQTETISEDPVLDLVPANNIFLPQTYYLDLSIPPYIRLDDVWKDIREVLPTSLQDVLQHYEYTTSLTLAIDDPAKAAWQSYIPEMAHSHDFLVNCVLSVASLHLGRLHENRAEKGRMNALAAARMNKALLKYRPELETITKKNAAALFASSTLTAVYLFRTSAIDIENLRASIPPETVVPPPEIVDKMMACTLRTIWGLRGPLTVLMSGWDWVISGRMHHVAARKWWPKHPVPATPRAHEEDERLARIEDLWMTTDRSWGPHRNHLSQALDYLRESFGLVSQLTLANKFPPMTAVPYSIDDSTVGVLTDRGAIFVWAVRISREFIQLIEQKDRDALVILAHYAILPGRVRNVWWLEGLGADFVTAIAMALGSENWHLIAWPASVLGVDLSNPFAVRKDALEGQPHEMHMNVI